MRRQLLRIKESSIRLSDYPSLKGASRDQQTRVRKIYDETADRIRPAITTFDEAMTDIAPQLPGDMYSLFTAYVAFVIATLESDDTYRNKGWIVSTGNVRGR
jgi:hypothetical protein